MLKKTLLVIALLALTFGLYGCGQKSAVEKNLQNTFGENTDVEVNDDEIKITTDEGSFQAGGNVKLPEGFPKDVYIMEGQIMSAFKNAQGDDAYQVVIKAKSNDVAVAKELYNQKFIEAGWKITALVDMGNAAMVTATKGSMTASVTLGTEPGQDGMAVMLTVTNNN